MISMDSLSCEYQLKISTLLLSWCYQSNLHTLLEYDDRGDCLSLKNERTTQPIINEIHVNYLIE